MNRPHIVHLIDDVTAGGVMRVLQHLTSSPELARTARHSVRQVKKGALSLGRVDADIIVSHLSISWRSLPGLIGLRAMHPHLSLVHVEHSYTQAFSSLNVKNKTRFYTLLSGAYALFDRVVAVSHTQGRWLKDRNLVDEFAVRVIPSSVDLSAFLALPPASGRVRVLGAIGRLDHQKGFDTLIKAFVTCGGTDLRLKIFGDGPERDNLRAMAAGDTRIQFMGYSMDPVAAMASVDAIVMPSRWEAYGLVALEARAAGRPVLVANVDGLNDHIANGAIGVNGESVTLWARAIAALTGGQGRRQIAQPAQDCRENSFHDAWAELISELQVPLAKAS